MYIVFSTHFNTPFAIQKRFMGIVFIVREDKQNVL